MAKKEMTPEKKKSIYLTLTIVFILLCLFIGKTAIGMGIFTAVDVVLSVKWLDGVANDNYGNTYNNAHQYTSNYPSGNDVYFFEKIDLGSRSDGYYYSIARMGGQFDYDEGEGEYVVLKKYGSYPEVDFFAFRQPELPPANGYRISYNLAEEDFSDLIDDDFRNGYPEVFTGKTNDFFLVVDMDNDILMTFAELEQERSDRINQGVASVMDLMFLMFLSIVGIIIAIPLAALTIVLFFLAFVFLILFIIFFCNYRELKNSEKTVKAT